MEEEKEIEIRSPQSIRPWQHVLEPLSGYLLLAKKMWENPGKYCEGWNFGPEAESISTVWEVASKVVDNYGRGNLKDVSNSKDLHEAKLLMLDISKARFRLGWKPRLNVDDTVAFTVDWYKNYRTQNPYFLCVSQIESFCKQDA